MGLLRWCGCLLASAVAWSAPRAAAQTTVSTAGGANDTSGASSADPSSAAATPRTAAPTNAGSASPPVQEAVAAPWSGPVNAPGPITTVGEAKPAASPPDQRETIAKLVAGQPDWACDYGGHAITDRHVIVACEGGLLLTLVRTQTGVQLVGRRQVNGRVTEFYEQGGSVWARITSESAEAILPGKLVATGVASGASPSPSETVQPKTVRGNPSPRATSVRGRVSRVDGRDVVVDLSEGHGLKEGDRLALSQPTTGTDVFFAADPVVTRIVRVMDDQVLARLGMNETVEVGYGAEATSERETASRRAPPRVYDVWDVRAVLRPILNLGSVGGGLSGEFGLARRTEHFRFGVNVSPLAFAGATGRDTLFAGGGYVFAAVDHAVYSAGVGVGTDTVNDTDSESEAGSGLSVVQLLRIGAVDGLHLESRVEAVIFRSEVLFGYLQLQGQLAVADNTWLVIRGGGGSVGYGFGEVVVRNLLWGTGRADSTFLELGLGGAGLFQQSCPEVPPVVSVGNVPECTDTDIGGPLFTAGLEWRL